MKVLLSVFFYNHGIMFHKFLPQAWSVKSILDIWGILYDFHETIHTKIATFIEGQYLWKLHNKIMVKTILQNPFWNVLKTEKMLA